MGHATFLCPADGVSQSSTVKLQAIADGDLDVTATLSDDRKQLVLHVVNPLTKAINTKVELNGTKSHSGSATLTQLAGEPDGTNSLTQPKRIIPANLKVNFNSHNFDYTFLASSYSILLFNLLN
ncbi:alpha-L-arabinofuranosidase C-terminal domain-containing protein [Mucilaginibacter roseus]|uniref:alpha-L-arabinofuranosidase C-terminal domain-containing protein n=1 Tax=Mucilaginibacter roseus TaxID=1528868 RepID=UPI0021D48531|nr:alpha-L-arabinofuranosidase C-terminal domain-containing protein [Mucilaginibacter roseus]